MKNKFSRYIFKKYIKTLDFLNQICYINRANLSLLHINIYNLREWLSGRALPCQGKCRGFESRLPLQIWYHRQVVRPRSAKPLFPGSNPGGTSSEEKTAGFSSAFVLSKVL